MRSKLEQPSRNVKARHRQQARGPRLAMATSMLDTQQSVASVVLAHSACANVLQRYRIDYCCRGELTLEAACLERGLALAPLLDELEEAIRTRAGEQGVDPTTLSTPALLRLIVATHHDYLREALPFVERLAAKVLRVHGEHNPLLAELDVVVRALASTLVPHLDAEEQVVFPALLAEPPDPGVIWTELQVMQRDHLAVGALLERLRNATEDYAVPGWACNSYRTLFAELEVLERDVLRHVHLENHVLRPRFAAALDGR